MPIEGPVISADLSVDYASKPRALHHVSFKIGQGEILGLVGESGSGKSTVALAIMKLLDAKAATVSGQLVFKGRDLLTASESEMRAVRGRDIGLVLQSPLASLNPALRIRTQLAEAWRAHARGAESDMERAVEGSLASVGLPTDREFRNRYPSQISVGQAQRVLIAMAVMHLPALLIADEPTSALDAITQAEILRLIADLNRRMEMAVLYISHDLASVASICHRIAVLRHGELVDVGSRDDILLRPAHPYTQQLLSSVRQLAIPTAHAAERLLVVA